MEGYFVALDKSFFPKTGEATLESTNLPILATPISQDQAPTTTTGEENINLPNLPSPKSPSSRVSVPTTESVEANQEILLKQNSSPLTSVPQSPSSEAPSRPQTPEEPQLPGQFIETPQPYLYRPSMFNPLPQTPFSQNIGLTAPGARRKRTNIIPAGNTGE
ncbi:hypothetical protein K3495_g13103 [Podosphaera aphanis]|nr:hypothetical protein K3495_g13103 [Podosphaera aphanis]